jgi:integrase
MATLQKRGGKWRAIVRITGHPATTKTFDNKSMAKEWASKTENAIKSGNMPSIEGKRLFSDVLDEYLAHMRLKGLKTEKAIERMLEEWRNKLGAYELSRINTSLITQETLKLANSFSGAKGAKKTKVAGATVNRKLAVLSGFFQWAVKERGIVRYLSTKEREDLFAACKADSNKALYTLVAVACYSGMRRSEVLGLKWDDVDLVEGWATLKDTKNGEDRMVPVKGPALTALREWRNRDRFTTGRVFKCGFPPQAWYRALERAGVVSFHFHDLRHTAASYLVQSGAELLDVAKILGHKSLDMVMRYAHLSPKRVSDVMDTMISQFG